MYICEKKKILSGRKNNDRKHLNFYLHAYSRVRRQMTSVGFKQFYKQF